MTKGFVPWAFASAGDRSSNQIVEENGLGALGGVLGGPRWCCRSCRVGVAVSVKPIWVQIRVQSRSVKDFDPLFSTQKDFVLLG